MTRFILFLTLCGLFLLSACGGQSAADNTTPPNADHLAEFNEDGIAVLRGHLSGGGFSATRSTIKITIPVRVDGMDASVHVEFYLRSDTEISSSLTTHNDVREYLTFTPGSTILDAFASYALVDITFQKKGTAFEATAIREAAQTFALFDQRPVIESMLSTDDLSQQGGIRGYIGQSKKENDGTIIWMVSIPIDMHGVAVVVILPVQSTANMQVITKDGIVPVTTKDPWGDVQIEFTRNGDTLTATQVTEIP